MNTDRTYGRVVLGVFVGFELGFEFRGVFRVPEPRLVLFRLKRNGVIDS